MSKGIRLSLGFASALFAFALTACGGGGGGGAIVTVNGQTITRDQLDKQLENTPAAKQLVQQLVANKLIDQYQKQHNVTISDAEIDKAENQIKSQYPGDSWNMLLKQKGLTENDVRDIIRRQLVVNKAVGGNVQVSDAQIKSYFAKNHAQFDQPPQVHARHILVSNLNTANKVEADLKAGKDFAAEAKQYSNDPGSKEKGGDLGWFARHTMVPSFEAYAFSAPIGQTSPPIKSPFGYHVIQVLGRKPAQTATLANSRDKIAAQLRQQQVQPLVPQFLQQLQSNAKIHVDDPAFADVFPSPGPSAASAAAPAPTTTK